MLHATCYMYILHFCTLDSILLQHCYVQVFLSRQIETLPATLIRGKCSVTLLSEVETIASYTGREDAFCELHLPNCKIKSLTGLDCTVCGVAVYALVYDPHQKTLLADRGNIRIGSEYQAVVPQLAGAGGQDRNEEQLEEIQWKSDNNLQDEKVIHSIHCISHKVATYLNSVSYFLRYV